MTEIIKFKCGICKDGIYRTRFAMRRHISTHLRNSFFNITPKGQKKVPRAEIIREEFT